MMTRTTISSIRVKPAWERRLKVVQSEFMSLSGGSLP
jgi:hypothetical protein